MRSLCLPPGITYTLQPYVTKVLSATLHGPVDLWAHLLRRRRNKSRLEYMLQDRDTVLLGSSRHATVARWALLVP